MTPVQRVERARTVLASTVVLAALLWSGAAGLGVLALVATAAVFGAGTTEAMMAGRWPAIAAAAIAAAIVAVVTVLWRARAVWSMERVALWLEERAPALQYALVTVVDRRSTSGRGLADERQAALIAAAGRADLEAIVRRSVGRRLGRAVVAVLVAGAAVRLLHAVERLTQADRSRDREASVTPVGNRLARLRVEIVPPAYSGLPRRVVTDPTRVAGLVGSHLRLLGEGAPAGITAIIDRDTLVQDTVTAQAQAAGAAWVVPVSMPELPGLLRLQDRGYHRSLVLEPLLDSAPRVRLRRPATDTTWRWDQPPHGTLTLEAEIDDDYGIDAAFFEILVSTGSEESFETRDRSTARFHFGGQRHGTLRATVAYAALGVVPGTVLHIRAVAYDNNDVADSAGKGTSETRTLRVATKAEADTTYVTPTAPQPIDSLWVGQRQLNAWTDTLTQLRHPRLTPDNYVDTSIAYADKQKAIRQRVEEVIVLLEDDGVGGRVVTESSRLLREASEQMWGARQYLAIGQPDSAYMPAKSPMKEALRLLEAARKAHKYYLRGVVQIRPVDIAAARLQGADGGQAADRTPRNIPENLRRRLQHQLAALTPLALATPQDAVDSLMRLRAVALRGAPAVAAALQAAIEAARQGQSAAVALARAQRLLDPPPRLIVGPVEWGGGGLP